MKSCKAKRNYDYAVTNGWVEMEDFSKFIYNSGISFLVKKTRKNDYPRLVHFARKEGASVIPDMQDDGKTIRAFKIARHGDEGLLVEDLVRRNRRANSYRKNVTTDALNSAKCGLLPVREGKELKLLPETIEV